MTEGVSKPSLRVWILLIGLTDAFQREALEFGGLVGSASSGGC